MIYDITALDTLGLEALGLEALELEALGFEQIAILQDCEERNVVLYCCMHFVSLSFS